MGGVVSSVTGKDKKMEAEAEQQKKKLRQERDEAARLAGERQGAAKRSRQGGRGLLSDTRLNPEQGVSTLGQTGL